MAQVVAREQQRFAAVVTERDQRIDALKRDLAASTAHVSELSEAVTECTLRLRESEARLAEATAVGVKADSKASGLFREAAGM